MAEPKDIARRVYREIGLPEPVVRHYSSIEDAISEFPKWKRQASPLIANYWEHQYPILHPDSYWASYHLYDEGFQFDVTRTPNKYGCYVYANYESKIPIEPKLLYGRYLSAVIDAVKNNSESDADRAVRRIVVDHPEFIRELDRIFRREDPTNQMSVDDYVFLGGFAWLRIERDILRDMRGWVKRPACEEHYQNVNLLCDCRALFLTFRKLVLWTGLPTDA